MFWSPPYPESMRDLEIATKACIRLREILRAGCFEFVGGRESTACTLCQWTKSQPTNPATKPEYANA
eukprot:scaffold15034_cov181-Amphora_coffeaeformis.AAC.5